MSASRCWLVLLAGLLAAGAILGSVEGRAASRLERDAAGTLDTLSSSQRQLLQNDRTEDLFEAAREGELKTANTAIKNGADIGFADKDGVTPMMTAAFFGHPKIVRRLVRLGADKDASTKVGFTALMFASQEGHADVVKVLLEYNATIDKRDSGGATALYKAAEYGHADVVQLLVNAGANVEARFFATEATPIVIATEKGHLDVIKVLIKNGTNTETGNEDGTTAIKKACGSPDGLEIVKVLHKYNANIDVKDNEGETCLSIAAFFGNSDIITFLLAKGVKVNATDEDGGSPIEDVCKCLDVQKKNSDLQCPKGHCRPGEAKMLRQLLRMALDEQERQVVPQEPACDDISSRLDELRCEVISIQEGQ